MNCSRFRTLPGRTALAAAALCVLAGCATKIDSAAADCTDRARFEHGVGGTPVPPVCGALEPDMAYGLGEMIRERRETIERIRLRLRVRPTDNDREILRLRQELIRAEGELPELEGLARLEGWLPPATLPQR